MNQHDAEIVRQLSMMSGRHFDGRKPIMASVPEVTAANLPQVMSDALAIHQINCEDITFLYNYFRGIQPILLRKKDIRPEICNKIIENHAYEAVSFKLSYEFSYPVQYVSRGEPNKSDRVSNLERFMRSENKYSDDGEIAQWMYICGQGYRFCLPGRNEDDGPFRLAALDPRCGFVIYSSDAFHAPLAGVVVTENARKEKVYTVYTPNMVFTYIGGKVTSAPITLGYVPVIEYRLNPERMGAFEPVLPLMNAINILDSNALDGVEQVVQAIIAVVGAEVTQEQLDAVITNGGILNIKAAPGIQTTIQTVAEKIQQTELDASKDRLYRMALTIMGIPDRNGQTTNGSDTGEAVSLRNGWSVAEARALMTERFWNAAETRFLKLAIRICNDIAPDEIGDLGISDIDIKFTRNLSDNLLVKTQSLTNLKQAGIAKELAIQAIGLFSDPHAVAEASTLWDEGNGTPSVSIAFKDLPAAGKIQAAAKFGITLTDKDIAEANAVATSAQPAPTVAAQPQESA